MTDYDKIEQVRKIILELLENCGIQAQVDYEESLIKGLIFNITSADSHLLIGRQGSHLHALQVLIQALVARKLNPKEPLWFTVDVDDYKMKREWYLKETARAAVEHIQKTGRSVRLEPMPNYERKFIHAYLQKNYPDMDSESQGEEPRRKVVIKSKKLKS